MAKRTPATSTTPRKRAATKKKPNGETGEIELNGNSFTISPSTKPTDDDIRVRAYHRYLERGAGDGTDFDDWVEAEKDLKSSRS